MARRLWLFAFFLAILTPAACLAWRWRSMPHLGFYHDDGLYWVSAKSLAQGHGYRIESLPRNPYQTKYPPLFPALLAIIWRFNPQFPENLPLATLLAWSLFPIFIVLCWRLFGRWQFTPRERIALTAMTAVNPMAVLFSFSLMPELLFTTLLIAALLMADRSGWISSLFAALAFLTKTAAMPLAFTVPLVLLLNKKLKHAVSFLAIFAAVGIGWQLWVQTHLVKSANWVESYYTDYFGFGTYNVGISDLPTIAWYNLDALLMAIGKLLTFDVAIFESKHVERIVAVAAIAGSIRLARKVDSLQYPAFAAAFTFLLLIWHYQPDQRFVFPLAPLLLAGLWTEVKSLNQAILISWRKERWPACIAWSVLGACGLLVLACSTLGLSVFLPALMHSYQHDLESRRPAYNWLKDHLPTGAGVFAYDDPLVYLYAGRPSSGIPIPTKYFYHGNEAGLDHLVDEIPTLARQQGLTYILLTDSDFYRDLHATRAQRLAQAVRTGSCCRLEYRSPQTSIYKIVGQVDNLRPIGNRPSASQPGLSLAGRLGNK